jgi:hypothetical protein
MNFQALPLAALLAVGGALFFSAAIAAELSPAATAPSLLTITCSKITELDDESLFVNRAHFSLAANGTASEIGLVSGEIRRDETDLATDLTQKIYFSAINCAGDKAHKYSFNCDGKVSGAARVTEDGEKQFIVTSVANGTTVQTFNVSECTIK